MPGDSEAFAAGRATASPRTALVEHAGQRTIPEQYSLPIPDWDMA